MSDEQWVKQGFFGPLAAAQAAWAAVVVDGAQVGALVPLEGGPIIVDPETRTTGMFAVWTRPENPMPAPAGMFGADPSMVGRMVGA